jgi:tetratricopeptide (TPR) repeat protein
MQVKTSLFALAGIAVGFLIGFVLANSINRTEINQLRGELEDARKAARTSTNGSSANDLTDEEIRSKIAEADRDPTNVSYQKNLGLALYKYGSIKNDAQLMSEAARLLERALKLAPADMETTIGLGNAWFDIGYLNKDNDSLKKARSYYEAATARQPRDANLKTDLAMTYFLEEPPNDQKATEEFKQALDSDPKNQKALQFIVQSLARQGDKASAAKYLDRLKEAYPSDESINSLSSQVNSDSQNAPK